MSVKTQKTEKAPSANTTMIHVNDLHLGNNVARDTVAGKQGHSPEDISRLVMAIEEADMFRRMMGKMSEAPVERPDGTVEYRLGENREMRRRRQQQERRERKKEKA